MNTENLDWVEVIYIQTSLVFVEALLYVHKLLNSDPKRISTNIKRFSRPEYMSSTSNIFIVPTQCLTNNAIHFTLFNVTFIHELARVIP